MDIKGHPKRPLQRDQLPLARLVDTFFAATREEDPKLLRYLDDLDEHGRNELAGVLGRFDRKGRGELDAQQRLLARRIVGRLHRPTHHSLTLTNRVLDYLDLDTNALIDDAELELCVEILELFAHAESDNNTLSEHELELLHQVLRDVDTNNNGVLDPNERARLRRWLEKPAELFARLRAKS